MLASSHGAGRGWPGQSAGAPPSIPAPDGLMSRMRNWWSTTTTPSPMASNARARATGTRCSWRRYSRSMAKISPVKAKECGVGSSPCSGNAPVR